MSVSKVFVVGGTGAQGIPIIRGLVSDGRYAIKVLTRGATSTRAKHLLSLGPQVELFQGTLTSEEDLRKGLEGRDGIFLNIDGFTVGEKVEMFWTMRIYELAVDLQRGYNPKYRAGHYDAKGRMADWLLGQHKLNKGKAFYDMTMAIFTTGPYIEMAIAKGTPMAPTVEKDEDGQDVVIWRAPFTEHGAVPHVYLDDCAHYVRWLFDNPDQDGIDLEVAVDHIHYTDLAAAFESVTGCKARFVDVSFEEYWAEGPMRSQASAPAGHQTNVNEAGAMLVQDNFTAFWNIWRDSGRNKGVVQRDYALLDKIHPQRVRSVEQYIRLADEKLKAEGSSLLEHVKEAKLVLKLQEDGHRRLE
ncbi:hypothetical protein S40288_09375 [Stachybotrys chartarum IBT 40288]|nr:hypothetical protein S40288_09375 [Stachybotrys chartarum IBT 40288]